MCKWCFSVYICYITRIQKKKKKKKKKKNAQVASSVQNDSVKINASCNQWGMKLNAFKTMVIIISGSKGHFLPAPLHPPQPSWYNSEWHLKWILKIIGCDSILNLHLSLTYAAPSRQYLAKKVVHLCEYLKVVSLSLSLSLWWCCFSECLPLFCFLFHNLNILLHSFILQLLIFFLITLWTVQLIRSTFCFMVWILME